MGHPKNKRKATLVSDSEDPDYDPSNSKQSKQNRPTKKGIRRVQKKEEEVKFKCPDGVDAKFFQPEVIPKDLGFASLGGMGETIHLLEKLVINPLRHIDQAKKFHVKISKGIIFHGPPGTGKTLLAKALAAELSKIGQKKYTFFYRKGTDLLSKYVGETEGNVKALFDVAKANKPSIIFLDELDGLAASRNDDTSNQHHNSVVCSILPQWDNFSSGDILVIGATNRLESLDPAFRREGRFDTEILFRIPNHEGRKEIMKVYFDKWEKSNQPSQELVEELADRSVGYTGADLCGLCNMACRCAFNRTLTVSGKDLKDSHMLREDWLNALKEVEPTNTNVFGEQNFAGTRIPLSYEPLIGGIKKEIYDWSQGMFNPDSLGFRFSLVWSESEKFLEDIDEILLPAVLTSMIGKDRQIVIITKDKMADLTKILTQVGKSSVQTLIYFPRLDNLSKQWMELLVKSLRSCKTFRAKKPRLLVIGSSSCGLNHLDKDLTKLDQYGPEDCCLKIRQPSLSEVKSFLHSAAAPKGKTENRQFDAAIGEIVEKVNDLSSILDIENELASGVQIKTLVKRLRKISEAEAESENENESEGENDSEDGNEVENNSEEESGDEEVSDNDGIDNEE